MAQIMLYYTDGTQSRHNAGRLDRDEVDQFLDDISQGLGAVAVVDDGPLAVPPGVRDLRRVEVLGLTGDAWLDGRDEEVDLDQ